MLCLMKSVICSVQKGCIHSLTNAVYTLPNSCESSVPEQSKSKWRKSCANVRNEEISAAESFAMPDRDDSGAVNQSIN